MQVVSHWYNVWLVCVGLSDIPGKMRNGADDQKTDANTPENGNTTHDDTDKSTAVEMYEPDKLIWTEVRCRPIMTKASRRNYKQGYDCKYETVAVAKSRLDSIGEAVSNRSLRMCEWCENGKQQIPATYMLRNHEELHMRNGSVAWPNQLEPARISSE